MLSPDFPHVTIALLPADAAITKIKFQEGEAKKGNDDKKKKSISNKTE